MKSNADSTAIQEDETQRQHRFILYTRNDSVPWAYDRILNVVRSIVFESEPFPTGLFSSLNKQSTLRPENFEYFLPRASGIGCSITSTRVGAS